MTIANDANVAIVSSCTNSQPAMPVALLVRRETNGAYRTLTQPGSQNVEVTKIDGTHTRAYNRVSLAVSKQQELLSTCTSVYKIDNSACHDRQIESIALRIAFPPLSIGTWLPDFAERVIEECALIANNNCVAVDRGMTAMLLLDASININTGSRSADYEAAQYALLSDARRIELSRRGFVLKVPLFSRYFSNGHVFSISCLGDDANVSIAVTLRSVRHLVCGTNGSSPSDHCDAVVDVDFVTSGGTGDSEQRVLPSDAIVGELQSLTRDSYMLRRSTAPTSVGMDVDCYGITTAIVLTTWTTTSKDDKCIDSWHPFTSCTLFINGTEHSTYTADEMRHDNWQRSGFQRAPLARRAYCFTLAPCRIGAPHRGADGINMSRVNTAVLKFTRTPEQFWPADGVSDEFGFNAYSIASNIEHWQRNTGDVGGCCTYKFDTSANECSSAIKTICSTVAVTAAAVGTKPTDDLNAAYDAMVASIPLENRCLYKHSADIKLVVDAVHSTAGWTCKPKFVHETPTWVDVNCAEHMSRWAASVSGGGPAPNTTTTSNGVVVSTPFTFSFSS